MTNEEKLAHFQNAATEGINRKKAAALREYQDALDKEFARHRETTELQMKDELAAQRVLARREMNRDLSAESLEIKHRLSMEQQKLTDRIFGEVKDKLKKFKQTPEYTEMLVRLIGKVKELSGGDDVKISIDPKDEELIPELEKRTGMHIDITEEAVFGGIEARIESKNIFMDETFKRALEDARENYRFEEVTE